LVLPLAKHCINAMIAKSRLITSSAIEIGPTF